MKIKKVLLSFLPGIFLIGFNIGTGSVTTMAKAGASYGMSLLWTILISCWITYFLIYNFGKVALITGDTALHLFRKHIHPAVGIFFIVGLTAIIAAAIMGVMGIIADVSNEWTKAVWDIDIEPFFFALFYIAIIYAVFWMGRTEFFEKVLAVIVGIMGLCFIINFILMMPPLKDVLNGLIPQIPVARVGDDTSPFLVVASMVGTTVFSGIFIIRTTLVREAGWSMEQDKHQRRDAMVAGILMFIINMTIMAAAAGVLYKEGVILEDTVQMVNLLKPLAGVFAVSIFVVGIIAAGLSSQLPNVLLFPWLLCDYTKIPRNMKRKNFRWIVFGMSLFGLIVPIFHGRPLAVMVMTQAFGALILPVTVTCLMIIGNKAKLMGKYRYGVLKNIVLSLILAFSLYMSFNGLKGLSKYFKADTNEIVQI